MAGRFDEARAVVSEASAEFAERGSTVALALLKAHSEAKGELVAGDAVAAASAGEEGCRLLEEAGDRGFLSTACAILAEAYYELGRLDDAYAQTLRSEELGASDDLANEEQWREARAKVLARRGEAEQAERLAREALEISQQTQHPDGEALLALGEVLELVGKPEEAARGYKAAVESFEQKGVVPLAERGRERLGA